MIAKSVFLFLLTCLFEVGGGYLIWLWLREGKAFWIGAIGAILLVLYGVVATLQSQSFGKVYVGYGAFFIVFSLLWAMGFDGFSPDRFDVLGMFIILLGAGIILYFPR